MSHEKDALSHCYLISDEIEFYPDSNIIRSVSDGREITLFSTASRCLLLLILRQGEVVPQRELMSYAWNEHGLSVSPNAFYQNVSSLRKRLAELKPDEDIIRTVKRVGLTISNDTDVSVIAPFQTAPASLEKTNEVDSIAANNEIVRYYSVRPDNIIRYRKNSRLWNSLYILLASLVPVVAIAIMHLFGYIELVDKKEYKDPFNNYVLLKKINDSCSIYINPGAGELDPDNPFLNLDENGCKGYGRVYITTFEGRKDSSAIYCKKDGENFKACVSEYYARSQK